jgi:hypothetical protein
MGAAQDLPEDGAEARVEVGGGLVAQWFAKLRVVASPYPMAVLLVSAGYGRA